MTSSVSMFQTIRVANLLWAIFMWFFQVIQLDTEQSPRDFFIRMPLRDLDSAFVFTDKINFSRALRVRVRHGSLCNLFQRHGHIYRFTFRIYGEWIDHQPPLDPRVKGRVPAVVSPHGKR